MHLIMKIIKVHVQALVLQLDWTVIYLSRHLLQIWIVYNIKKILKRQQITGINLWRYGKVFSITYTRSVLYIIFGFFPTLLPSLNDIAHWLFHSLVWFALWCKIKTFFAITMLSQIPRGTIGIDLLSYTRLMTRICQTFDWAYNFMEGMGYYT